MNGAWIEKNRFTMTDNGQIIRERELRYMTGRKLRIFRRIKEKLQGTRLYELLQLDNWKVVGNGR